MNIRHYVGKTEVASIVEVLKELDVAERLNLPNDSYTGTAVYQFMSKEFPIEKSIAVVGVTGYHSKARLMERATAYLNRKTVTPAQRKLASAVIRFIKEDPAKAEQFAHLIK